MERTVVVHRACLREPAPATGDSEAADKPEPQYLAEDRFGDEQLLDVCGRERTLVARHRERYAAITELHARGLSNLAISRELGICTRTVHRFLLGASVEEVLVPVANRSAKIDRFRPYLNERWNQGCTSAAILQGELQQLGWRGSLRTVNRYTQRLRTVATPPPPAPVPPKPRRVAGWIMSDPDHLPESSTIALKSILARCPELKAARWHVGAFANMIQNLGGDRLPAWIEQVRADDLPELHRFADGLQRDQEAVTAGLTLPWSNGPTEGTVNRIKYLKRQIYGRANLDLLRLRILSSD